MDWLTDELKSIIIKRSNEYGLSHALIIAIISAESAGDWFAVRYEPNFNYAYQVNKHALLNRISSETERNLQKTSIGLMQCMGCICRELGFSGNLLRLTDPETSIIYGCKKLRQLSDKYDLESDVISSFNCGSVKKRGGPYTNPHYVEKVLDYKKQVSHYF